MKRDTLIWKIVNVLHESGALDPDNYMTFVEQSIDVHDIIEKELIDYVIIEGRVINNE